MTEAARCQNCGAWMESTDVFCSECGHRQEVSAGGSATDPRTAEASASPGGMPASAPPRPSAPRFNASRDWPLAGAAVSAILSFAMLFPPWLTGGGNSENAFGDNLPAAGPALIIVMALTTVILIGMAATRNDRRFLMAALTPSSILLAIYLVKVADVSDLADLYNRLTDASFTGVRVSVGAAVWLGFVFGLLTLLFLLLAVGLKWGAGRTLAYPVTLTAPQEPQHAAPPKTYVSYPPPPDNPPRSAQEHPDR